MMKSTSSDALQHTIRSAVLGNWFSVALALWRSSAFDVPVPCRPSVRRVRKVELGGGNAKELMHRGWHRNVETETNTDAIGSVGRLGACAEVHVS